MPRKKKPHIIKDAEEVLTEHKSGRKVQVVSTSLEGKVSIKNLSLTKQCITFVGAGHEPVTFTLSPGESREMENLGWVTNLSQYANILKLD